MNLSLRRHQDIQRNIFKVSHSNFCRRVKPGIRRSSDELCYLHHRWDNLATENDVAISRQSLCRYGQVTVEPSTESNLCVNSQKCTWCWSGQGCRHHLPSSSRPTENGLLKATWNTNSFLLLSILCCQWAGQEQQMLTSHWAQSSHCESNP